MEMSILKGGVNVRTLILFAFAATAFGAGTVTQVVAKQGKTDIVTVTISFTGDASDGSVPATAMRRNGQDVDNIDGYSVIGVMTKPGATNPTANWDFSLLNADGLDLLASQCANRSASAVEWCSTDPRPINSVLTITIGGNSVNSATGTITIFLAKQTVARRGGTSSGGGGGGTVVSPYNATFASTASLSISNGTHALGTDCVWTPLVFTASGATLTRFGEGGYTCDNSTGAVTFAFSPAVAGRVMLIPGGSGAGGGGGGGDTTSVDNSGAGAQVLKTSTNVTARTLVAGSGCTVTENTDTITISCSGGGGSVGYYSSNVAFNPTSMSAGSNQSTTKSVAAAAVGDAIKIHEVPGMIDTCPYVRWEGAVLSVGVVTIYAINPHGAPTCDPDPAQNIPFSVMPQQ